MNKLPQTLQCLTIQHAINDPNVIEHFLREDTAGTEKCIPIAFREVFVTPATQFGAPSRVDASTLLNHLSALWNPSQRDYRRSMIDFIIDRGLYYFLPSLLTLTVDSPLRLIKMASYGDINTLSMLMNMFPDYVLDVDDLLWNAASFGNNDVVKWLLLPHTLNNPIRKVSGKVSAANPNTSVFSGITAVQSAIARGHFDTAKILFDAGATYKPIYRDIAMREKGNMAMVMYLDEMARKQKRGADGGVDDGSDKPYTSTNVPEDYWPVLKPTGQGHAPGMTVKKLDTEAAGADEYVLVFKPGDEVMSGLLKFAREHNIPSASVTAIGAHFPTPL